jgi:hypothetical protein
MADDLGDNFQTNPDDKNPLEDMKRNEELPEDNGTPFSPPQGTQDRIDSTHQSADTNIDPHEHYDEGIEGAAEVDLPGETADQDPELPEVTK